MSALHYAVNGYSTGCGQVMHYPSRAGDLGPRSYVDHEGCTNVEKNVRCADCKSWLILYRKHFPRGETLPEFWEIAAQKQKAREEREEASELRREVYATTRFQRFGARSRLSY